MADFILNFSICNTNIGINYLSKQDMIIVIFQTTKIKRNLYPKIVRKLTLNPL